MAAPKSRKLFLNLPIRELKRTVDFFTGLGFEFDPRFTNEQATCMVVGQDAYVMLLVGDFFETFARKPIADAHQTTGALYCVMVESREAVDAMVDKALELGGAQAGDTQDHGFMYGRSFYDLDGHHWEVSWMDASAAPTE